MENKQDDLNKNQKLKILICIVTMTFMSCIDGSIVNVALPLIARDLHSSMASVQWIITSYLITISVLILLFGRIGDIKGKCKVFKVGVFIFTLGSLFSTISKALPLLIASRIVQGIGAACTMAVSMGIISEIFSKEGRGHAMGISSSAVALGTMIGPALGGIIASFRWDFIFLINVPIGIIDLIVAMKILPKIKSDSTDKIDFKGTLAFGVFMICFVLSVTEGQFYGYTSKKILLGFLIAIIAFIIFIYLQKTVKSPILDLSLFKNHLFTLSVSCGFLSFIAVSCITIIEPFYLQDVLNMSTLKAGMFLIIYPLMLSIVSPLSGSLSDKINGEIISFIGILILAIGLFLMSTIKETTSLYSVGFYNMLMGIGNGIFKSPNNSLVMSKIRKDELGIAGSVNSLLRNIGMVFGITFATTLLYNKMSRILGYTVSNYVPGENTVFITSMNSVFLIASFACFAASILALIRYFKFGRNNS